MIEKKIINILKTLIEFPTVSGESRGKRALVAIKKFLPSFFAVKFFCKNNFWLAFYYPQGQPAVDILLNAHIDVVPAEKKMFKLVKKGDKLLGRGTFDMKGPLAAMIVALNVHCQKAFKLKIGLLITSDEEKGGHDGAEFFLKKTKIKPQAVIVPDGGNNFTLVIEEKGAMKVELSRRGLSAHTSRPWEGKNAAEELLKVVEKISKHFSPTDGKKWRTTAALTFFESKAPAENIIPDYAQARFHFRYIAQDLPRDIIKTIRDFDGRTRVKSQVTAEPMKVSSKAWPVSIFRRAVRRQTGSPPSLIKYPAACDARFFTRHGIPAIIARSAGGGAHADNEWISLKGLNKFVAVLLDFFAEAEKRI